MKVFLGGTCNNSTWRKILKSTLCIEYFDPVVDDWTPDCMEEEKRQRDSCDYCLYVITPEMTGVYSIAEVVDDSNKRPTKTVFCVLSGYQSGAAGARFKEGQWKSLQQVGKMVRGNGGTWLHSLVGVADYLNQQE